MKLQVFNQGFNRVEHHQIICLERAKLNRLLGEERRIIETLAHAVKRQIEAAPNQLVADAQAAWNSIENHSLVVAVREHINRLTNAYPQFLNQVEAARGRLKKRILDWLDGAKSTARMAAFCH